MPMDLKNTIVNNNENDIFLGCAYFSDGPGRDKRYRIKYREIVRNLMEKYWNSPYKAISTSRQYRFVELRLVIEFDLAERFYNPKFHSEHRAVRVSHLEMIANALEVNPILLYNDEALPLYLFP
jgi:hypothetical protein